MCVFTAYSTTQTAVSQTTNIENDWQDVLDVTAAPSNVTNGWYPI